MTAPILLGHALRSGDGQQPSVGRHLLRSGILGRAEAVIRTRLVGDEGASRCDLAENLRFQGRLVEAAREYEALATVLGAPPSVRRLAAILRGATPPAVPKGTPRAVPFAVIDSFLTARDVTNLAHALIARAAADWHPAAVSGVRVPRLRNTVVGDVPEPWAARLMDGLAVRLSSLQARLELPPVGGIRFELQSTLYRDGTYFAPHHDAGSRNSERSMTLVLFCQRTDAQFEGGELLLYDELEGDGRVATGAFTCVRPTTGRLVVFPATALHEVVPVRVPSGRVEDARLVVNGWILRGSPTVRRDEESEALDDPGGASSSRRWPG